MHHVSSVIVYTMTTSIYFSVFRDTTFDSSRTGDSMEPPPKPSMSLFEVYLRLRPPHITSSDERFLEIDDNASKIPTHITVKPPTNDFRKRAIEKFEFTRVFEDDASQLDVFNGAHVQELLAGVLGRAGSVGKDGLLATLGVTGSGKVGIIFEMSCTRLNLNRVTQSSGRNHKEA